jgi:hypothetical protein
MPALAAGTRRAGGQQLRACPGSGGRMRTGRGNVSGCSCVGLESACEIGTLRPQQRLEHDPEKHALGLDPMGYRFPKRSCSTKDLG